ncbi:uncharacterized protein [Montipora capricornis]|uniref:uncharacterized protein n=2 Tax=Montipora foliosa TaxID=591990 RepID=UPI0035F170F0
MGKTKGKRRASQKQTKEPAPQRGFKEALVAEMRSLGFDGDFFARNLDQSIERSTRRGKGPRRTRYIQYCTWAHALMRKEIGPEDAEFAFPEVVLDYIRHIAPGDIKGEIREDAYKVSLQDFCSAIDLPRLTDESSHP